MVWFAPLVKMVGQQVGLELLRTAGREVGKRLAKADPVGPDDEQDRRIQDLERRLDEQNRELAALGQAVATFSERFERFIGRAIAASLGSLLIALGAVVLTLAI